MSATKVLSINEIRTNIDRFVAEWSEDTNERAEAQTFWNEFLACFGVSRRRVASFEQRATRASTANIGRIDMFWPRVMIAEHKSAGMMRDDSAENQALDYLHGGDISSHEFPRYVISSDFQSFRLKDLDGEDGSATITFPLNKLRDHVEDFIWLAGYEAREFSTKEQEVASVKAAKYMAQLYVAMVGDKDEGLVENKSDEDEDSLAASILLTRLLFLLFGDDAGLWERGLFEEFLEKRTTEDGSDLGSQLSSLFEILNTPESQRSPRADEIMLQFPYVNGDLFAERQATEFFDREMREALLDASRFDWTAISPAVFGSLFQEIKSKAARREHGEFYTTEANILKTLEPLFLDEIRAQVKSAWKNAKKLREIHASFENMQYFDPACGCGNFLIVAYREMRAIELEILERLRELEGKKGAISIDGEAELNVSLNQFYGIELNWWPAKIAEVAMFLVDHQANREMALRLGLAPNRLPISITPRIHHGNALHTDWSSLLEPTADTLVFGNPPFSGQSTREAEQAADLETVWGAGYNGYLDYVTGWHAKTMQFFERGGGQRYGQWAFVTTNSITQGDAVSALFQPIFDADWKIKFAHRPFAWKSETSGGAAIHCVIIGFTRDQEIKPRLFDYAEPKADPHEVTANHLNAYLVDGPKLFVNKAMKPIASGLPEVSKGSAPVDGGNLLIEPEEFDEVAADPGAAKYLRQFVGAAELIHAKTRHCLWLTDLDPKDVERSLILKSRIEAVKNFRLASKKKPTREAANSPHLFIERRQPADSYLCIPSHVSETRRYFLADRFSSAVIASNANFTALDPDGFLFGLISSSMFITWQRTVGGRLESRLRFSNTIVWNNFPLPTISDVQRKAIIEAGEGVLAARALHPERSLADHYNPLAMAPELLVAHRALDVVVDRAFGAPKTLDSERDRQILLFERYLELVDPLAIGL